MNISSSPYDAYFISTTIFVLFFGHFVSNPRLPNKTPILIYSIPLGLRTEIMGVLITYFPPIASNCKIFILSLSQVSSDSLVLHLM